MQYYVVTRDGKVLFSGSFPKAMTYYTTAVNIEGAQYVNVMNGRDMAMYLQSIGK